MKCLVAREILETTVGGTLSPADAGFADAVGSDLRAHLAGCDACSALRDEIAAAAAAFGASMTADRAAEAAADAALAAAVDAEIARRLPAGRVRRFPVPAMLSRAAVVLVALGVGWAWSRSRDDAAPPVTRATYRLCPDAPADYAGPRFIDVSSAAGVDDVDHTGLAGQKDWMVETVGHGAAVFDMDGDGDLDLFVPDGNRLDPKQRVRGTWRLYRNDGGMRFADVTADSGLDVDSWASGAVAGDVDGDGRPDLYVPCFGRNHLFRNLGGGKFRDVTAASGAAGNESEWSTAASFGDLDADGDLDLYVCNYADMRRYLVEARGPRDCRWREMPVACGPQPLEAQRDRVFLNRGDGTFDDVTDSRLPEIRRYSFQAVILDLDRDGALDVYVASDAQPNVLLRNDGTGRFTEIGASAGVASNGAGIDQASMGVAAGDVDDDGRIDLFVTNFSHESNCLYRNVGVPTTVFGDVTAAAGLELPSRMTLGWGATFSDLDNDGDLDLVYANGHLYPNVERNVPETTYLQHAAVMENDGQGRFREVTAAAGEVLRPRAHRGVVAADFDDDGATDLFLTVLNDRAVMLRNDARGVGRTTRFVLRRADGAVEAAGARLTADVEGVPGRTRIVRDLTIGSSFGSSEDPRVAVGLGSSGRVSAVQVRWPAGVGSPDAKVLPPEGDAGFEPGAVYEVVEGRARARRLR